jgi:hypothetical protein
VEHLKGVLLEKSLALPANIRLGWRGLPGTNTLAYYENPEITVEKSLIVLTPGACTIKLFTAVIVAVS